MTTVTVNSSIHHPRIVRVISCCDPRSCTVKHSTILSRAYHSYVWEAFITEKISHRHIQVSYFTFILVTCSVSLLVSQHQQLIIHNSCMHVYICMCVCMYVRMYVCVHVCGYVCIYFLYVCVYVCIHFLYTG